MDQQNVSMSAGESRENPRSRLMQLSGSAPVWIIVVTIALAGLVLYQSLQETGELKERIREENRLRLETSLDHVKDYFGAVYSLLLFISQDSAVMAMRQDALPLIQKLYDHGSEEHWLAEIYIVERDFRGDRRPFMVFQRPPAQVRPSMFEQEEYAIQMEHIRRFASDPGLKALLSQEIRLCQHAPDGERTRGLVYSVPIRSEGKLVGIVAGMIRSQKVLDSLRSGNRSQIVALADERGGILAAGGTEPAVRDWFRQGFERDGVAGFFSTAPEVLSLPGWVGLWSPVRIPAGEKSWLVLLYRETDDLQQAAFGGILGHSALAGSLMLAGGMLAFLVRVMTKRVQEQAQHSQSRKRLERQVYEVNDRVQRRVGETLHEDICQRLIGIQLMAKVLQNTLDAAGSPDARVAAEITTEVRDALTDAREMADELQPVPMLQHGLAAALSDLARRTERRFGIACRLDNAGFPSDVGGATATHLYRVAQEALNNAVAHAHASEITIQLSADELLTTLRVSDNGIGIPSDAEEGPGMGLKLMRYRCDLFGATLQIQTAQGSGTTVRCSCPRAKRQEDRSLSP